MFGFREAGKLTEGLFAQIPGTDYPPKLKFLNYARMLEVVAARQLASSQNIPSSVLEANDTRVEFVKDLFGFLSGRCAFEFPGKVAGVLAGVPLSRGSPEFRLAVTNLFLLAHSFEGLHEEIIKRIFTLMVAVDTEVGGRARCQGKFHEDADFLMKFFLVYLRLHDKPCSKSPARFREPLIDYYAGKVKPVSQASHRGKFERVVSFLIESFFEVVLRLDSPTFLHFLMPAVCTLKTHPTAEQVSFSDLFFKEAVQRLVSKNTPSVLKERLLSLLHAYVRFANVESTFIFGVVHSLQKFLFLKTKKLLKTVRASHPDETTWGSDSKAEGLLRAGLKNPLFARLVCTITSLLTDNMEVMSTHAKIDIINLFELYFARFFDVLKGPITQIPEAKEVFLRLNKFLRISKLAELDGSVAAPGPVASPLPKRNLIASTYCSLASLSQFSLADSIDQENEPQTPGQGPWRLGAPEVTFDHPEFSFFKELRCRHGRSGVPAKSRPEPGDLSSDSLAVSRRSSFSDKELPELFGRSKRVKNM